MFIINDIDIIQTDANKIQYQLTDVEKKTITKQSNDCTHH